MKRTREQKEKDLEEQIQKETLNFDDKVIDEDEELLSEPQEPEIEVENGEEEDFF